MVPQTRGNCGPHLSFHAAAFDPKTTSSTGKTNATGHFIRL
jgi:hypothetical protein